MTWLLIGAGGALGAMARHALNSAVHRLAPATAFPYGILVANVLGSGAIGLVAGLLAAERIQLSTELRVFAIVGLLGGFTTFSSFSLDTLTLMRGGHWAHAAANVAGHLALGLAAVVLGFRLGRADLRTWFP